MATVLWSNPPKANRSNTERSHRQHLQPSVTSSKLTPAQSGTFPSSANIIPLLRSQHDLQHSSRALRRRAARINLNDFSNADDSQTFRDGHAILRSTGASFLAPISFGTQTFLSILDTGSADTWVVGSSFTCLDIATHLTKPQQKCSFGPTFEDDPISFSQIQGQNFNITYGDGEFLTGAVGNIDITLAGITVPKQQVSLVDRAAWQGDGLTSGLIGLAYPALTAVYPGTDPATDTYCGPQVQASHCNQIVYSSLIDSMFFGSRKAEPFFSLALSRDESRSGSGGYLTLGGIPDLATVDVVADVFATTPIRMLPGDDRFRYYLINIEGIVMLPAGAAMPNERLETHEGENSTQGKDSGSGLNSTGFATTKSGSTTSDENIARSDNEDYILDSGTTLSFIPADLIQRFVSNFSPPGRLDRNSEYYLVDCDAGVPSIGVKIGGIVFWFNQKDLVKRFNSLGKTCIVGIQSSRSLGGINILGDTFLDSVLAVFDIGRNAVSFAARREYQS